jgi:hypothetical protein
MKSLTTAETVYSKIKKEIIRLENYLTTTSPKDLCAVFDIGTKGVRVIVGPKMTLDQFERWNPDILDPFFISAVNAQLGAEFEKDDGILDLESTSLTNTILFIKSVREKLSFLSKKDFIIVGTAVFRWLQNQDLVLEYVEKKTDLPRLQVLAAFEEAYYSLLAIVFTHAKITGEPIYKKKFTDKDIILLLDQGGGSTEISYIFPSTPSKMELTSMFHIGTVALEKKFSLKYRIEQHEPTTLQVTIKESLHRVEEYISGQIDGLKNFDRILPYKANQLSEYNIIVFGMGTALKVCFEQFYGSQLRQRIPGGKFRGWILRIGELEETYSKVKTELINKYITVARIKKNNPREGENPSFDLDSKLQMLYGLKTYESLMRKFRIPAISYGYYNLKYGVYLQNFVKGVDKIFFPPKRANIFSANQAIKSAKERVYILDTIKIGTTEAASFHNFILDTIVYIFGNKLANPKKEVKLNQGRQRVDIVFDNIDTLGFFWRLSNHYRILCPKIFIECKNSSDLRSEVFQQIADRMTSSKGMFGIMICRNNLNTKRVTQICRDQFSNQKKLIIVLDDQDIKTLLIFKEYNHDDQVDSFLGDKIDEIIM